MPGYAHVVTVGPDGSRRIARPAAIITTDPADPTGEALAIVDSVDGTPLRHDPGTGVWHRCAGGRAADATIIDGITGEDWWDTEGWEAAADMRLCGFGFRIARYAGVFPFPLDGRRVDGYLLASA